MRSAPALVLLSLGRHPASGRVRRAVRDARALTLALRTGLPVVGVHAGPPDATLRDYIGMGLERLVTLDVAGDVDPASLLSAYARTVAPHIVFAGTAAEAGSGSGLVPYLVADALGMSLAPDIMAVAPRPEGFELIQALPRGGRRILRAPCPLVATVGDHGPEPCQVARGPALRGLLQSGAPAPIPIANLVPVPTTTRPARARPKRLAPAAGETTNSTSRLLVKPSPQEAAEAILEFLETERLLPRSVAARPRQPEKSR